MNPDNEEQANKKMLADTRPPGRPSQGRTQRIQAMISEELFGWLNNQRGPHETVSDTVNRFLRGRMVQLWNYIELMPLDSNRQPNSLANQDRILGYTDASAGFRSLGSDSFGLPRLIAYGELSRQGYEITEQPNIMRQPAEK